MMPALKGPNGKTEYPIRMYSTIMPNRIVITAKNKNIEISLRYFDYFYSLEGRRLADFGPEGTMWEYADKTKKAWKKKAIPSGMTEQEFRYKKISVSYILPGYDREKGDPNYIDNSTKDMDAYQKANHNLFYDSDKLYYGAKPVNPLPRLLMFDKDESLQKADFTTLMQGKVNNFVRGAISGTVNIDTQWDAYISDLNKANLPKYVKLFQDKYDKTKSAK